MSVNKNTYSIILFFFYFLFTVNLSAQEGDNVHYKYRKEHIQVLGEQGYISEISYKGMFTSFEDRKILIPYTELDSVYDIKAAYFNEKGKRKYLKEDRIHQSSLLTSSFYAGVKAYFFEYIDKTTKEYPFEYSYTVSNKELITLSHILVNDEIETDSFLYDIEVPTGYCAYFDIHKRKGVLIDSVVSATGTSYHIEAVTKAKIEPLKNKSRDIHHGGLPPFIRLIVVPEEYKKDPYAAINSWYNKLVLPQSSLNDETKNCIKNIMPSTTDKDSIAAAVFNYVRSKISYIDVENGIGAYQPRDVNAILRNKQGDCKDMANLVCQALNFCGVEAYMALSSSLFNAYDFDFPSGSSADHAICVARINDKWQYLDATEMECMYGLPSRHIQGRNIFIINKEDGQLHKVRALTPEENTIVMKANYFVKDNVMEGSFAYKLRGLIQMNIRTLNRILNVLEYNTYIQKAFESSAQNVWYTDISTEVGKEEISLHGFIKAENKLMHNGSENLLLLSFVPFPHAFPKDMNKNEKLITMNAEKKEYTCSIIYDKPLKLKEELVVHYVKDGFEFHFKGEHVSENSLQVSYKYICNHLEIKDDLIDTYNEINKLMTKTFNSVLTYE